jgi:two-component system, LytTR family, sensor kinase
MTRGTKPALHAVSSVCVPPQLRSQHPLKTPRSRNSPLTLPRTAAPPESLAQTGEYSIFGLAPAADQTLLRERQVGFTLLLFAVATVIALLYSVERYFYNQLVGYPVSLTQLVPAELIFTYAWALLTPLVMHTAKRFPVWGHPSVRNWAVQIAAMVTFVVIHLVIFSLATVALDPAVSMSGLPRVFGQSMLSWTVLDSLVFCAIVVVHHAVVYYRVSKDRALRASQLETRLAQAQLQMLRMQLQPHFLFNTLHSISALMHKDVRRADSMVAALSDLLRMSLQNIGAQEVPLQSELDFLQRYVEIMTLRFGERLKVSIEVDPETRDARVPNLFLQPLVENSFRHGFGDLGQGSIAISVRRDGDMLRCDVVDDGRGLRAGHKEGVGLASTRQRLAHLYGERQIFSLRGAPGEGVHVTMAIPFHPYERAAAD